MPPVVEFVFVRQWPDWAKPYQYAFDLVLNTADRTHECNIPDYLSLCKIGGSFHQVGVPDGPLPPLQIPALMGNGCSISGSHIGNRQECLSMLKLAGDKKLFPIIETIALSEAGVTEAVTRVSNGNVKYRIVLTDFEQVFG